MADHNQGVIATIMSGDCTKHIAWLKAVFGAEQKEIYHTQDKKYVMHCDMMVNGGHLYICDSASSSEEKLLSEKEREAESSGILLQVECKDPNPFWKNALNNGASIVEDLKKRFWGAVYGQVRDPFGFVWGLMEGGECRKSGVIPYLMVRGCEAYLEWAEKALGCTVKDKYMTEKNQVQHCSVELSGGVLYLGEDIDGPPPASEGELVQSHVILHRNVPDPKTQWDKLLSNGASTLVELEVQFWGDLYGTARDAKGYCWSFCQASPSSSAKSKKEKGVLAYIISPDCKKHVEWIEFVFGGKVEVMNKVESGDVMHCQMTINGGMLMMSDRFNMTKPDTPEPIPKDASATANNIGSGGNAGILLHMFLDDPDAVWKKAMEKGATEKVPLKKQFWGDYYGQFQDPLGYIWAILKND